MKSPNYQIIEETADYILIQDLGPWDFYPTITNAAELVVKELLPKLHICKKLYYLDSEGEKAEILIVDGQFGGFCFV
jgi:hypothetical protein